MLSGAALFKQEKWIQSFELVYLLERGKFIVLEKIKEIELASYELEHIELHFVDNESSDHAAFVDAVLCCFRPRSLTLRSSFSLTNFEAFSLTDFEEQSALVKLLEQENQGHTLIQIVSPYSSKAHNQFRGLMLLPEPLPREEKAISFIKEEACFYASTLVARFRSLIQLRLEKVLIYDEVITYLASSCPLLQVIQIRCCPGFIRFCVHGHQNLQQVKIQYTTTPVERLDIEAPNLSSLLIVDAYGRGAPLMNLASCKKLTQVVYIGNPLPNSNAFRDFLSNFPFVETLGLFTHNGCNNLMLSSHSLRALVLCSNCALEEIELKTPKLVSFRYACSSSRLLPMVMDNHWTLSRDSTHLKARMRCYPGAYIDTLWFQKLRYFLSKKNGFKVFNLYIYARYSQKFKELERLKAIELPPYELEHVELQLESHEESLAHIAFVEAILWCCRPRSLALRSSSPLTYSDDVVKFTYQKLLEQEHSRDIKSLSIALTSEGKAVTFIKEKDETVKKHADMEIF
ncbi:putative leucine-rich repeat domain superfamily [Helianthus debilis subsp. tardiflorus]